MTSISVLIQTHNEEERIADCIASAKLLTNAITVVDMESTDDTMTIAKQNGANVISFPYSHYVEPAREFGIKQMPTTWVFILDADERMTKELANEIQKTIDKTDYTYFKIPRKNMWNGKKWLRHGGWWPDAQMRLIKTSAFHSWPKEIHSTPTVTGKMGHLSEPFLHFFHGNIEQMVQKTLTFEDIESELLFQAHKPVSTPTFFRKFMGELCRRLIKRMGFLDGTIGIMEGLYQAFSKTITYLLLYEKKNRRPLHPLS